MDTGKVIFTQTVNVPEPDGREFVKGKVYDLPLTSCDRWVRRLVAKYYSPDNAEIIDADNDIPDDSHAARK